MKTKSFLSALQDFARLFYPSCCLGCSGALVKGEEILCTACIISLPKTNYAWTEENPIKDKFSGRLPLKYAWAFLKFRKTGIVQHLLHQLKYNNHPEIGIRLGRLMGRSIEGNNLTHSFDEIVAMPLHSTREMSRGYNQSRKIAEGISAQTGIPVKENVLRTFYTTTQTVKTRDERWQNVATAFQIKDGSIVKDKRILLVDDIITTGATLEACGQQLVANGCAELSIACVAEA
ncbi:MAG: ComF family protein [Bacteroidetes bacterium]|nr:ComF family protein [Bacteroidota bacterium]MBS1540715.1 ComF family protein [Bacteroidota bacterium]